MKFDLRTPIGLLFATFGAILALYGLVSPESAHDRSMGININLLWGFVLLVFGAIMLALALVSKRKGAKK